MTSPLSLLRIILTLMAGPAALFLTSSCERRGGVPLTAKAEDARLTVVRRIFLADSSRWLAPRAEEIAALTRQEDELKRKWRGLTIPASGGGEAATVARELTVLRQKMDRLCGDRSLLREEAKALWDQYESAAWAGFAIKDSETGYKDPYAYYASLPKREEQHFLAQRAKIEAPLWTALEAARRQRDDLSRELSAAAKPVPADPGRTAAETELRARTLKVNEAAAQFEAVESETARLQKEWEAKNWAGYVMD